MPCSVTNTSGRTNTSLSTGCGYAIHYTAPKVEQRFSPSRIRQIKKGLKNGASVDEAHTIEEIREFSNMLRHLYSSRIRKHFPNIIFFQHMDTRLIHSKQGKIFIVRYKGKIIGGSACIYSGNDAYLWFSGGMRKTYALQYPGILAVWKALQDAHQNGFRHMEFMDAGLPSRNTVTATSYSASAANKAVPDAGSASAGSG